MPVDNIKHAVVLEHFLYYVMLQYIIRAPKDGRIKHVPHQVGETVQKGTPLILLEDE